MIKLNKVIKTLESKNINKKIKYIKSKYTDTIIECIRHLRKDIIIYRLTGDGPKDLLIAPLWSRDKKKVLNTINHKLKTKNVHQGEAY